MDHEILASPLLSFLESGVYQMRGSSPEVTTARASVIVKSAPKQHRILVEDDGFEPQVLAIAPGDSVLWVWWVALEPGCHKRCPEMASQQSQPSIHPLSFLLFHKA